VLSLEFFSLGYAGCQDNRCARDSYTSIEIKLNRHENHVTD
jgi:hypothetical protein